MKDQNGFSLIELLIVVVILAILATLAIAGLLASRRSANEGSAVSSIRLLHSSQMTYATSFGLGDYAGDIGAGTTTGLGILRSHELIDPVLASGSKSGYNFVGGREAASAGSPAQFFFSSIPVSSDPLSGTGLHRLGIATDGIMRQDEAATAHWTSAAAVFAASPMGG